MTPSIRICPSAKKAAAHAAAEIARVLRRRGRPVVFLASGKTMVLVYEELVRMYRAGRVSFCRARTFNLDELAVGPEDPRSFRSFMDRHLLSRVDFDPRRAGYLRGDAPNLDAEAARYERALHRAGKADLAIVGIGTNGHVAYLEPGRSVAPSTSLVELSARTRRVLAADGLRPVPRRALTMGIETILSAREILLVATGRSKAAAVAEALEGPVSPRCPASFLSLHPRLIVVLDRAGAARLAGKETVAKKR
jgi:glucosamine-6-phosphate deaminase